MTPAQCRGARAMLGWTRERLAKAANISDKTIASFEGTNKAIKDSTLAELVAALEKAGVAFVEVGGAPGVVLRRRRGRK